LKTTGIGPLSQTETELTEVYLRFTLACNIEPNAGLENNRNRPPLQTERELTEVYLQFTLACNIEPNAGLENNRVRLPLPRERAGVRGYDLKPCRETTNSPNKKNGPASAGPFSFGDL